MTNRILVDSLSLECRWVGATTPGRPVLVLLHEGLGSVSLWRDFPERLAAVTGLAVFAYSRQGYGGSDTITLPRPYDYQYREAALLPRVLETAGIERAALVGHSDGATIALIHAATAPADTVAVVAMAPHSFVEDLTLAGIRAAREAYLAGPLRQGVARHHGDQVDAAFWGWNDTWLNPDFAPRLNLRPILPAIRAPLLVIQGEDDEYGTALQVDTITSLVPDARPLLLPACGHSPQRGQPEQVLAAIGDFLAGLAGA